MPDETNSQSNTQPTAETAAAADVAAEAAADPVADSTADPTADPAASCDSACSSCAADCTSRSEPQDWHAKPNDFTQIKQIIAVVSGKGGVGKSLVTSTLACALQAQGKQVGILDADITGPSVPKAFGVSEKLRANVAGLLPSVSAGGIQVVSTNLILPEDTTPVLWRGTIISGLVRQFFSEVTWGELDYLLIDMPPGTGDVPLTVYQSLPINGVVVVTAPQALVSMIVGKAINMAATMNVPILGLVENLSYFQCPDCGNRHDIFGPSQLDALAKEYNITLTARLPIDSNYASLMDSGQIEQAQIPEITAFATTLSAELEATTNSTTDA
ncbi:MAG: Mrp/NBP35 family ATP-binding protein [Coriobacteriales bacterium]|jgi:Mrp family chromosome partitioning ATPase|nr:Mrp/NBP35 family ATP-binding protein [Coriobacteriales bacterium]